MRQPDRRRRSRGSRRHGAAWDATDLAPFRCLEAFASVKTQNVGVKFLHAGSNIHLLVNTAAVCSIKLQNIKLENFHVRSDFFFK